MIVEKFGIDALKDKAYSSGSSPSSEVFGIAGSFSITSLQPSFPNVLVVLIFGFPNDIGKRRLCFQIVMVSIFGCCCYFRGHRMGSRFL